MTALLPRDEKVFGFIRSEMKAHGVAPSFREIALFLGLSQNSKSTVQRIMDRLKWAGKLRQTAHRARCIELIETKDNHSADCPCGVCGAARYLAERKLVEAIQAPAPVWLSGKRLNGIAPVSELTKVYWLKGFPRSLRPNRSAA